MNFSYFLKNLNNQQLEAVVGPNNNMLILAGAGSGKTRVLVHRIAWLVSFNKVPPSSIMAVTFTNKAAFEMRDRINLIVGSNLKSNIWVGTFHSLAYRILKIHYVDANLPQNFRILDIDDQYRLLRRIIKSIGLNESMWSVKQAMCYINSKKDIGLRPQYINHYDNFREKTWLRVYESYHQACERSGLVDFSELLLKVYELFLYKSHILKYYRNRFRNILVDEFQDTNNIQYAWIRLLAGNINKVITVGDDDQSIYGWRGAKVENIRRFLKDFPAVKTIRLEQNYRSSNNILKSANMLIANNNDRLGKNLWTQGENGDFISLYSACNELDEAMYVVNNINKWNQKGCALKECAILYRNKAQSRIFEEILLQSSISYEIYGGKSFFERPEIKNVLSYLCLVVNHNDDTSFERIINIPKRGIGKKTLDVVQQIAHKEKITLWRSCEYLLSKKILPIRELKNIKYFLTLISTLSDEILGIPLDMQIYKIIYNSGLWSMYQKENNNNSKVCIENLQELISSSRKWMDIEDSDAMLLQSFLSKIALNFNEKHVNINHDAVQLMTLHAAKGLEFPIVFIVGMEEGIFPTKMSIQDIEGLAEERRLAYVGLTRAMKKLTLTYAKSRRLYGKEVYHLPSRFIKELPRECVEEVFITKMTYPIKY
ncbi:DNA helicase II [Arsenophonus symbiont of Ornithomya chloropus]|uniref:DNA helicase II n=1 Tax=Arsenophonus symbiont of Ornithomya chloropus TaxID=634121 RepID=UPI0032B24569